MDITMITKEHIRQKNCLFCASDYHLEMILLPYIKTKIKKMNFIIFTENNLEKSISTLLEKVNFNEEEKLEIKKINWKSGDKYEELKKYIKSNKEISIIINGKIKYIKKINCYIEKLIGENVNIIECFHIDDKEVNAKEISSKYDNILNCYNLKK